MMENKKLTIDCVKDYMIEYYEAAGQYGYAEEVKTMDEDKLMEIYSQLANNKKQEILF